MTAILRRLLGLLPKLRRARFVLLAQLKARLAGAELDLQIAPDVRIDNGASLHVHPRSRGNRLVIGPRCRIEEDVYIQLNGGDVEMVEDVELRRRTVLNVQGRLLFRGGNILSYATIVHCAERITLDRYASSSEYVTIVDSRHFHTDEDTFLYHNMESAPVVIGANTWLAPKSTVLPGVTIGDCVVVGAHSLVTKDVPPKTLVAGSPAKPIRPTL